MSRLLPCCRIPVQLLLVYLSLAITSTAIGQSFGNFLTHKSVELNRKLPPVYDLHGKSVSVSVNGNNRAGGTDTELQSAIERLLTGADSTVHVDTVSPDLVISGDITNFDAPHVVTTVDGKTTTQTMVGGLNVAFRISEKRGGRIIASAVATTQIIRDIGSGAAGPFHLPSVHAQKGEKNVTSTLDAQNAMVSDAAKQIASYLVITPEVVPVQLAVGGSLKEADDLAKTSLWARDLEKLETLTPLPDPRLDAYRVYNIGVAKEALAYQAQDQTAAVKYLQEASIDYGKATAARPDEKSFLAPQNRIAAALEHYGPGRTAKLDPTDHKEAPVASEILSDDDVIDMVGAHVDDAAIIDTIKTAPKVNFDLSSKGLIRLAHGGVKGPVLTAMQQRARATPAVK